MNDPGNAGTASSPPQAHWQDSPAEQPRDTAEQRHDTHRRHMSLWTAILAALILVPAVILGILAGLQWLPIGLGAWFAAMMIVAGLLNYRYGQLPRSAR